MLSVKSCFIAILFNGCIVAGSTASASPELASAWQKQASSLRSELEGSGGTPLPAELVSDIERFGRIAGRLANSGTSEHPLPMDLACIFRGMEEETSLQLSVLSETIEAATKKAAMERLILMLKDAEIVGQAAVLELGGLSSSDITLSETQRSCASADPNTVD